MPNSKQIALARVLLTKAGRMDLKEAIVSGFTNGRTEHISSMHPAEFTAFIRHLQSNLPNADAADNMRRKIISLAHEMGWYKTDTTGKLLFKNGKPIIDVPRIDGWCKTYGYLKKSLNSYEYAELPKLVSQFTKVYDDYLHKI